ncbi:MAG: hypothetical protein ACLP0J_01975 [Solirubrobacteraceae bacterium]|jgi:hypothetical protein
MNRRPKLSLIAPKVSPEEAAAVVAALEQFMRQTVPTRVASEPQPSAWQQTALREAVLKPQPVAAHWD